MDGGLEIRRAARSPLGPVAGLGKTRVEVGGYAMHVCVEAVAFPMHVLAEVDASGPKMGKHLFQRHQLLFGFVAAIVDEDVNPRMLMLESLPEPAIRLVAYRDARPIVLVHPARFLDVDAVDLALRAEILSPHRKAASAVNPDFEHVHLASHELAEMPMVELEVVDPFPDARTLPVGLEVRL
jgi:hypothetical protein